MKEVPHFATNSFVVYGDPESFSQFDHFVVRSKQHEVNVISYRTRWQYSHSLIHTIFSVHSWLIKHKTFPILEPFCTDVEPNLIRGVLPVKISLQNYVALKLPPLSDHVYFFLSALFRRLYNIFDVVQGLEREAIFANVVHIISLLLIIVTSRTHPAWINDLIWANNFFSFAVNRWFIFYSAWLC